MTKLKAIVVGVSNYYIEGVDNLSFCKNDIEVMERALCSGLKVDSKDVISCGYSGDVKIEEFKKVLLDSASLVNEQDTLIFYFSGHGASIDDNHFLVFSDGIISTQEIIGYFEKINSRSKIIFLDCCYSGNYSVNGLSTFNVEETVEEFHGRGYAVFSSSNADQVSYGHPDKPISLFTAFLCDALQDKHLIREGKVTLHDIKKLVSLYLDIWNKKNPTMQQQPIFRANMGGTIFFNVEDYTPFYVPSVKYEDCDEYLIYSVEPSHTGALKRYAVKVILKEPFSLEEISRVALEVNEKIKKVDIYKNKIAQDRWTGKNANIIWVYFGRDESDMINGNFICHTTWVDDKQDKEKWYSLEPKETVMIKGIHFRMHSYYDSIKIFRELNKEDDVELAISNMRVILSNILTCAEKVINLYNEYKNDDITELALIEEINKLIPEIEKYYFMSQELNIAPDKIHDWYEACMCLVGTVHDFTLYYGKKYLEQRTPENRMNCMEWLIKQYYTDLESVKQLENQLK